MRAHYPDEGSVGTYGVDPAVIDAFVRSCGKPFTYEWDDILHSVAIQRGIVSSPTYSALGTVIWTISLLRRMVRTIFLSR